MAVETILLIVLVFLGGCAAVVNLLVPRRRPPGGGEIDPCVDCLSMPWSEEWGLPPCSPERCGRTRIDGIGMLP